MYNISDGWFKQSHRVASPNFNERPESMAVDAIIIHSISLPPGCYTGHDIDQFFSNQLDWDKDPFYDSIRGMEVSAHLLIRRSGELIQYVNLFSRAWHAGQSRLYERENCNDFSIGIELEGTDNSPFEKAQYDTLNGVVKALLGYFPQISKARIVGHSDIAPGRKTDPGCGFDWDEFNARLNPVKYIKKTAHAKKVNMTVYTGHLRKMQVYYEDSSKPVDYFLPLTDADGQMNGEQPNSSRIALNPLLGQRLSIQYKQEIHCVACGRKTSKSFNQGYCYPCFSRLAACDKCIMSPEKCHYEQGTCREPQWGLDNCMQPHYVYLANSSGLKVGITRGNQIPIRWIDQGAIQALPVFKVSSRYYSGLVEVLYKQQISDRTQWQRMLKGQVEEMDLVQQQQQLYDLFSKQVTGMAAELPEGAIEHLENEVMTEILYPVTEYPQKIKSFNLDKQALVEGTLLGIKGQYLILDTGVINIRKFSGYHIDLSIEGS